MANDGRQIQEPFDARAQLSHILLSRASRDYV